MAHQRQDETKQPPPPPSTETTTTLVTTSDMYLSTHLIVPYFITAGGEIKRPEHLIAWWSRIFSFYVPDDKDRIELRSLCRLFRDALRPPPVWTTFPHPNYPTLNSLIDTLNEMYVSLPNIIWEECTAPSGTLVVGTEVRAKFVERWGTSIKDATIQKVNEDETFDVVFGDRRTRKNVPLNEIQIQNVSANDLLYRFHFHMCCTLFSLTRCSSFFAFFFYSLFHIMLILNRRKVSWQKRKRTKKSLSNLF